MAFRPCFGIYIGLSLFRIPYDSVCQKCSIDLSNISDSLLKKFIETLLLSGFPPMNTQPSVLNKAMARLSYLFDFLYTNVSVARLLRLKLKCLYHLIVLILFLLDE